VGCTNAFIALTQAKLTRRRGDSLYNGVASKDIVNELDQGRDDDELQDVNVDSIQHSRSGEAATDSISLSFSRVKWDLHRRGGQRHQRLGHRRQQTDPVAAGKAVDSPEGAQGPPSGARSSL
jgi:hypothetical protein